MSKFNQQRPPSNGSAKAAQPEVIATASSPATNERKQDIRSPAKDGGQNVGHAVKSTGKPNGADTAAKPDPAEGGTPAVGKTASP